jgi:hypothetical protein
VHIENVLFEVDQLSATVAGLLRALRDAALRDSVTIAWAAALAAALAVLLTVVGSAIRRPSTRALLFGLRWPLGAGALLIAALREPATATTRAAFAGVTLVGMLWVGFALLRRCALWLRQRSRTPWQAAAAERLLEQLKQRLGEEIARAKRRADHAVTLLALRRVGGPAPKSARARDALRTELLAVLRPYDAFAQDDRGTLFVLLPGTDAIDAQAVVPRARQACAAADPRQPSSDAFACGFASYPASGATVDELVRAASSGMTVGEGARPAWCAALATD